MIYVGKWRFLPEDWEGINGLYEKSQDEIRAEIARQMDIEIDVDGEYSHNLIGSYTYEEFEETFNADTISLCGMNFFIKIF